MLALSGLFWGLALQTHPLVVAFLPGVALFLLCSAPASLRTRWPYLAACLFLVAYSNMIIYNLTTGFHTIKTAKSRDAGYTDYQSHDLASYVVSRALAPRMAAQGLRP